MLASGQRSSVSLVFSLAIMLVVSASGCAQQRKWGGCALTGALLGAAAGATSGIVIVDNTTHHHLHDKRAIGGGVGAAVGAVVAGVAMHYLCDQVIENPQPAPPPAVAEAAPPPPPAPVPPHAPAQRLVLRGVHFAFNKADIRPESEPILDEAAEVLKKNPHILVDVNGYTDDIGGEDYNLNLSERRAESVANYLESRGISAERLIAHGFGKTNFVASNATDEGRAENRRVELIPKQG